VTGLSVLARGTVEEKLEWAFGLYDVNGDGVIGRDEMLNIVSAIYDMIGKCAVPSVEESAIIEHVDRIFQVIGLCLLQLPAGCFLGFDSWGRRAESPSGVQGGAPLGVWELR